MKMYLLMLGALVPQVSSLYSTSDSVMSTGMLWTESHLEFHFKGCRDILVRLFCGARTYDVVERGYTNTIGFVRDSVTRKRLFSYIPSTEGCETSQPYWISWTGGLIASGKGNVGEHTHMQYDTKTPDLKCDMFEPVMTYSTGSAYCIDSIKMDNISFKRVSRGLPFNGRVLRILPRTPSRVVCASICLRTCPCFAVLHSVIDDLCSLIEDVKGQPMDSADIFMMK